MSASWGVDNKTLRLLYKCIRGRFEDHAAAYVPRIARNSRVWKAVEENFLTALAFCMKKKICITTIVPSMVRPGSQQCFLPPPSHFKLVSRQNKNAGKQGAYVFRCKAKNREGYYRLGIVLVGDGSSNTLIGRYKQHRNAAMKVVDSSSKFYFSFPFEETDHSLFIATFGSLEMYEFCDSDTIANDLLPKLKFSEKGLNPSTKEKKLNFALYLIELLGELFLNPSMNVSESSGFEKFFHRSNKKKRILDD